MKNNISIQSGGRDASSRDHKSQTNLLFYFYRLLGGLNMPLEQRSGLLDHQRVEGLQ